MAPPRKAAGQATPGHTDAPAPNPSGEAKDGFLQFELDTDGKEKIFTPEHAEIILDNYKKLARATKNPLYCWIAILHCRLNEMPTPDWCMNYLFSASAQIVMTINEARAPILSKEATYRHGVQPRITTKEANSRFLDALLFTKSKRNPFKQIAADEDDQHANAINEVAKIIPPAMRPEWGLNSEADVIRQIRDLHNLEHDRSAKRKIKRGRKLQNL